MIEDKELGVKIAEDSDEKFWTEMRDKCIEAEKTELRNIKVNKKLAELCEEELKDK
jgi:hypothetical protein